MFLLQSVDTVLGIGKLPLESLNFEFKLVSLLFQALKLKVQTAIQGVLIDPRPQALVLYLKTPQLALKSLNLTLTCDVALLGVDLGSGEHRR